MPDAPTDQQPTPAPAATPSSTPAAPVAPLKAEDLIGAGMVEAAQRRAATAPQDAAEPGRPAPRGVAPDDEDELDDEDLDGLDGDEDEDEGSDAPDADTPEAEAIERFAAILLQQPQRIDEVPRPLRREAIIRSQQAAYQMGLQQGRQAPGRAEASLPPADRAFVDLLDRQRQDDPDAFLEWAEANPAAAARYYAGRGGATPQRPDAPPTAAQQELPPEVQRLAQRATRALSRLDGNEGARQRLQAKADQGAYPPTEEGLEALLLDIGAEEARARSSDDTERQTALRRRAAGQRRQATARPDIGTRRASNQASEPDGPLNVRDLIAEGIKDTQARARTGQIRPAVRG